MSTLRPSQNCFRRFKPGRVNGSGFRLLSATQKVLVSMKHGGFAEWFPSDSVMTLHAWFLASSNVLLVCHPKARCLSATVVVDLTCFATFEHILQLHTEPDPSGAPRTRVSVVFQTCPHVTFVVLLPAGPSLPVVRAHSGRLRHSRRPRYGQSRIRSQELPFQVLVPPSQHAYHCKYTT